MLFSSSAATKRVVDVVFDSLIVVLALVGVLSALAGSQWAPLWVLVSVLGMAGQLVQTALDRADEWDPLGRSLVPRVTAVSAAAVCLEGSTPGLVQAVGAALGAAVLIGSIVIEPFVGRAARFKVPVATRLPNLPTRRPRRDLGAISVAAGAAAPTRGGRVGARRG